jgi:hypothetical protein
MDNINYGKLYGNTGIKLQLGGWIQWIGLGEKNREALYLMGTSMVSCRFSLETIH